MRFVIIKITVTAAAENSAITVANQMPSTCKNIGKIKTAAVSKIKVLKKEIIAETKPSFNAVKKDEPYIARGANKNEKE